MAAMSAMTLQQMHRSSHLSILNEKSKKLMAMFLQLYDIAHLIH